MSEVKTWDPDFSLGEMLDVGSIGDYVKTEDYREAMKNVVPLDFSVDVKTWDPDLHGEMHECPKISGDYVKIEDYKRLVMELDASKAPLFKTKFTTFSPAHMPDGVAMLEDPDGDWIRHAFIPETDVDVYTCTPSGRMKKNTKDPIGGYINGDWVHITDHRAHMAALDIQYKREDEKAVKGVKTAPPLEDTTKNEITPETAESWRFGFRATMGPYLHMDDNGHWIPWTVFQAVVKRITEGKNKAHITDLRRHQGEMDRRHRDFNRDRLAKKLRDTEESLRRADIELILTELAFHVSEGTVEDNMKRPDDDEMTEAAQRLARYTGNVYTAFEMEEEDDFDE